MIVLMHQELRHLVEVAQKFGDVVVVAPDSPQSGMGHAITIHDPLSVAIKLMSLMACRSLSMFWYSSRLCENCHRQNTYIENLICACQVSIMAQMLQSM
jgi:hypothetical protein